MAFFAGMIWSSILLLLALPQQFEALAIDVVIRDLWGTK
jgi:hypothetical protein